MDEVAKLLTWEHWAVAIVTALVVDAVSRRLPRLMSGEWISQALIANALVLPILAASPYSTFVGSWPMDLLMGLPVAGVYYIAAIWPSQRLRVFALFAPNLTMAAMLLMAYRLGIEPLWQSIAAMYPLAFVAYSPLIMVWFFIATMGRGPRAA